jgi:hypothetical protein
MLHHLCRQIINYIGLLSSQKCETMYENRPYWMNIVYTVILFSTKMAEIHLKMVHNFWSNLR